MKRAVSICIIIFSSAYLLTSCASYNAASLNTLSAVCVQSKAVDGVKVAAKAFNRADCNRYFDRDVLSAGYQPVQIYIQNDS